MLMQTTREIHTPAARPGTRFSSGFTLLELMIVILIIGLILTVLLNTGVFDRFEDAKVSITKTNIAKIKEALDMYKLDNGDYPTTEQGLAALIKKPEIDPIPKKWRTQGYINDAQLKDPWGNAFQYLYPGEKNKEKNLPDIYSLGKDATSDKDDIGNWK